MIDLKKILSDGWTRELIILVISGISIIISFFNIGNLPLDAAWIAIVLCGIPIFIETVIGLVRDRDIKAGLLVSIALIAAIAVGEIFAAGEIAFIMGIGEALEERTVKKARAGIEKLVDLTPQTARVVRSGKEETIKASDVRIGDVVRVLAGEAVPADGLVLKGKTSIDQSILTGESLPVDKTEGDEVFSGTVNQFGTFDMSVTASEEDSSLQRMIRLVQSADAGKAKIVRTADRWATWIVVIALTMAVLVWFATGDIIRSVTVLVVFCPCALVLATPTAIVAAIGNVTKYGMLVKEGDALERLASVKRLLFDKTGTLTHGKPAVAAVITFDEGFTEKDVMTLAASAELRSEHPLGKAIVRYAQDAELETSDPEEFEMILGRGVSAKIGGRSVSAGNTGLMEDMGVNVPKDASASCTGFIDSGCNVTYVAVDGKLVGSVVLSDTIRRESFRMVDELKGMGIRCTLLTGDNDASANHIARNVRIPSVRSNCLPEDKLDIVRRYEANGEKVAMIGDGVNDAPALKAATVGIAMGKVGSDIAIDAADITLIGDDIQNIPHLVGLSKKMMRTIKINLSFSLILNFTAIALAMTGILTPVTGALVHNAGSVVVILNSALLLGWKMRGTKHKRKSLAERPEEFCDVPNAA